MKHSDFWKLRTKESSVLNRVDRTSEILFGLIMVLTFTGAISAATDGREEVSELLWGALGCNLAWGFVDAIMYLMNVAIERGHAFSVIHRIANTDNSETAREILEEEIQPVVFSLMEKEELDRLINRLKQLPLPGRKLILNWKDLFSSFQIFLLVFFCIFPVALPFIFFDNVEFAMRASNAVALLLLFIAGYKLAKYAGFGKFLTALIYTGIGVFLVALTMALGG